MADLSLTLILLLTSLSLPEASDPDSKREISRQCSAWPQLPQGSQRFRPVSILYNTVICDYGLLRPSKHILHTVPSMGRAGVQHRPRQLSSEWAAKKTEPGGSGDRAMLPLTWKKAEQEGEERQAPVPPPGCQTQHGVLACPRTLTLHTSSSSFFFFS